MDSETIFRASISANDARWLAEFYRRDGYTEIANRLDAEADYFSRLADDAIVGLRRAIRRETGVVNQAMVNLQHG